MPTTPSAAIPFVLTTQVVDTRRAAENILGYIKFNQAAVLSLANFGKAMKSFVILNEIMADPNAVIYPNLELTTESKTVKEEDDVIAINYTAAIEAVIWSKNAATLPQMTNKYFYAVELLLANVPISVIAVNSPQSILGVTFIPSGTIDRVRTNEDHMQFTQVFRLSANYQITVSRYQ